MAPDVAARRFARHPAPWKAKQCATGPQRAERLARAAHATLGMIFCPSRPTSRHQCPIPAQPRTRRRAGRAPAHFMPSLSINQHAVIRLVCRGTSGRSPRAFRTRLVSTERSAVTCRLGPTRFVGRSWRSAPVMVSGMANNDRQRGLEPGESPCFALTGEPAPPACIGGGNIPLRTVLREERRKSAGLDVAPARLARWFKFGRLVVARRINRDGSVAAHANGKAFHIEKSGSGPQPADDALSWRIQARNEARWMPLDASMISVPVNQAAGLAAKVATPRPSAPLPAMARLSTTA